ncbi:MAG: hypothetical protein H0U49_06640 [Parachlamydiaceae bacterium]|nr:hypothetical protein [Parachlamydiaceae bacterium]
MQSLINLKHQIFLPTGIYTAASSFYSVYNSALARSTLAMTINKCTDNLFKGKIVDDSFLGSLSCREHIVKIFGPGTSIFSLQSISQTFDKLDVNLSVKLGSNLFIGILATLMAVSSVMNIRKKINNYVSPLSPARFIEGDTAEKKCHFYTFQMISLSACICSLSLFDSIYALIPLPSQRINALTAINTCCTKALNSTWYNYPPTKECMGAIQELFGNGSQVSSLPDLCGNGLSSLLETNKSAIISNVLMITMCVALPLGFLSKIGYDYYKSLPAKTSEIESEILSSSELEFINSEIENPDVNDISSEELT